MRIDEMFDSHRTTNLVQAEVDALTRTVAPGAKVDISVEEYEGQKYITVNLIRLPKDQRKHGIGSEIMKTLCGYADRKRIIMALTPTSEFGTSKAVLMRFYKSFGFVANSGCNKDWHLRETMIRCPRVNESIFSSICDK
jgi:GNAT superfamily N-acetyltransferase